MIGKEILNYRIVSFIGKGGMGSVYLAEHKFISTQRVAIKMINSNMANDYTRSRLKEEAEHLAELKHQNIVTFHDYHIDAEGNIYLIMEYADGKSLDDYIRTESGLIVQERICPIFEPILDAVGYAHKHNILHRDIKPSNIVITKDGTPKILDFGIATLIKRNGEEDNDHFVVGTPSYMSPEQVKGEKLDERSDIYSLGVMLHQMLTGNPPYDLTTMTELQINKKVVDEPLPRLRSYYRYVSDSVQKVVDKATAKNPADRYQNCAEFKKALHNAIYPPKVSKGLWIGIAAAVALVLGIGLYLWDYNRLKVTYYKDYVEQYGAPVGIGQVNEKVAHQRLATYRFESSQRKVRKVTLVNAKGHLCTHSDSEFKDRPARQEIYYSDNGNVDFVKIYDQAGKVLYRIDYNENLSVATLQYDDQHNTEFTLGNMDALSKDVSTAAGAEKSRISRYLLTYDENGYVIKKEYAGLYNKKVGDKNGIYAHVYTLDGKGRVIEDQYLGIDGQPKGLSNGLNIRTYTYDENDDWIETRYLTAERTASDNSQGITVIKLENDEWGNRISEKYYDLEGNMAYRSDELVAGIIYEVTEGQTRKYTFIGGNEEPCPTNLGVYTQIIDYDDYGYVSKVTYCDENGVPFVNTEGYAIVRRVNGPCEELLEWWAYDEKDSLMECSYGYAGLMGEYDSVGNVTKMIYYDINRQPKIMNDGTSGFIDEYDDKNRLVKIINIDGNSTPIEDEDGIAITHIRYDERGNMIQVAYYDTKDSALVLDKNSGIAGWNETFDDNGNDIKRAYFGTDGQPVLYNDCYAYYTMEYDENNFLVALYNYGVHGEKAVNTDKFHGYLYERDSKGNMTVETPIGIDGKLAYGYLITKYVYDDNNNVIETSYFDRNLAPATNAKNYHKTTSVYNQRGQELEERFYDTKGELTLSNRNCAIIKNEYNSKGQTYQVSFFGKDEKPCTNAEGYSIHRSEYDNFGRIIKQMFFDTEGKPTDPRVMVPVGLCGYDKYGNMNYIAAQDENGNFIIGPSIGFSIQRRVFDKAGNVLETTYFDQNDQPMNIAEGYHKEETQYNKAGRVTQEAYFDKNLNPVIVNGAHLKKFTYDEHGNKLTEEWYGKNGKPINNAYGYYKEVYTYDEKGEPKYAKTYAANGSLVNSYKYYPGTGWRVIEKQQSNPVAKKSQASWEDTVNEVNKELPYDMGEEVGHLTMVSFKVTGDKQCLIKYRIPLNNEDINDEVMAALKEVISQLTRNFCTNLFEEKGIRVDGNLYSADGKIIYAVAYQTSGSSSSSSSSSSTTSKSSTTTSASSTTTSKSSTNTTSNKVPTPPNGAGERTMAQLIYYPMGLGFMPMNGVGLTEWSNAPDLLSLVNANTSAEYNYSENESGDARNFYFKTLMVSHKMREGMPRYAFYKSGRSTGWWYTFRNCAQSDIDEWVKELNALDFNMTRNTRSEDKYTIRCYVGDKGAYHVKIELYQWTSSYEIWLHVSPKYNK